MGIQLYCAHCDALDAAAAHVDFGPCFVNNHLLNFQKRRMKVKPKKHLLVRRSPIPKAVILDPAIWTTDKRDGTPWHTRPN